MKTLTVTEKHNSQDYTVSLEHNKSIQINCTYKNHREPRPTLITFNIGDMAEYDSYNLSYLGKIVGISEKTVTILPEGYSSTRRLKLVEFCFRNWDFNLEKISARNHEELMCI